MPKGAKKRKAAKKKEKGAAHHHQSHNNHEAPHSAHGDDDLKHHDDKESETEEVNSPTSQDHANNQHDLTDGEKEENEKVDDTPHIPSSSEYGHSVDGPGVHHEVIQKVVEADHDLKLADQSNGMTENVDNVSNDGVLLERASEELVDKDTKATDVLPEDNATTVIVEPIKESEDAYQEQKSVVIDKTDASVEVVNSPAEGLHTVVDAILVGGKSDVVEENGSDAQVGKVALLDEKSNGDSVGSASSAMVLDVTVPGTKENGEKEAILLDRSYLPTTAANLVPENKGEEVIAKIDDVIAPSDVEVSVSQHPEGISMPPNNAPRADATNSADPMDNAVQKKDVEVSESSDRQPLSAVRPQPKTSWMSCCGLFEVFAGSNR